MHVYHANPMVLNCLAIAALFWVNGCSKSSSVKNPVASATLAVSTITVDLAKGSSLTFIPEHIYPDFQLTDHEVVSAPLIFGKNRSDLLGICNPMILREAGGAWKFVALTSLDHTEWVYAGAAIERNELWAILDSVSPARGPGLYLMRSTDEGLTWSLWSGIKPPALSAEFVSFTLEANGHGLVTVHADDDTPTVPRGLYLYQTSDGGKTWTGPAYKADDLLSSDPPAYPTLRETIDEIDPASLPPSPSYMFRSPPPRPPTPTNRNPPASVFGRGRRG